MKLLTIDEANIRLAHKNFKIIDRFKYMSHLALIQCGYCSATWEAIPNRCIANNYSCPECSINRNDLFKTNLNLISGEATYVYVFDIPNIGIKIGVTNKPNIRLRNFKSRNDLDLVVLKFTIKLPAREPALALEANVHSILWNFRVRNTGLVEGHSEIFSVEVDAAIGLIKRCYQDLFSSFI